MLVLKDNVVTRTKRSVRGPFNIEVLISDRERLSRINKFNVARPFHDKHLLMRCIRCRAVKTIRNFSVYVRTVETHPERTVVVNGRKIPCADTLALRRHRTCKACLKGITHARTKSITTTGRFIPVMPSGYMKPMITRMIKKIEKAHARSTR